MDKAMNACTVDNIGWFVDRWAAYVGYQKSIGRKAASFLAWAKKNSGSPNRRLDTHEAYQVWQNDRKVSA